MPASLATLPTELLRLIIELAVPPESLVFTAAKRRRGALLALTLVDKRLHSFAQPLLRKVVLVESVKQGERLRAASRNRREVVDTLLLSLNAENGNIGEILGGGGGHRREWAGIGQLLEALPLVKAVSISRLDTAGYIYVHSTNPFCGIERLAFSYCHILRHTPSPLVPSTIVYLALDRVIMLPGEHLFTPQIFPALRFLRVSVEDAGCFAFGLGIDFCHQLDAHQLQLNDWPPWPPGHGQLDLYTDVGALYRSNFLYDRMLVHWSDVLKRRAVWNGLRHLYCHNVVTGLSDLDGQRLNQLFPTLETFFVPRKSAGRLGMANLSCALAEVGAKVVWVNTEEGEYDFVLPEFERYLKAKQQGA